MCVFQIYIGDPPLLGSFSAFHMAENQEQRDAAWYRLVGLLVATVDEDYTEQADAITEQAAQQVRNHARNHAITRIQT